MSNKVKISALNSKMYSHSYRCTNSTSANFSYVQPLLCRMLMPNGSIKGSLKQFVRLTAMPKPTFGDLRVNNAAYFIPIETIMPEFMSMMSATPYRASGSSTAFVPSSTITTTNQMLYLLLYGNVGTKYGFSNVVTFSVPVDSRPKTLSNDVATSVLPATHSIDSPILLTFKEWYDRFYSQYLTDGDCYVESVSDNGEVFRNSTYNDFFITLCKKYEEGNYTLEQCQSLYNLYVGSPAISSYGTNASITSFQDVEASFDYLTVTAQLNEPTKSTILGFRLTDKGRALRKILLGLGYQPSADDVTTVSCLPLLAFYKAYYDRFIPYRMLPWETTSAFRLIEYHEQNSVSSYAKIVEPLTSSTASYDQIFSDFMVNELANCFSSRGEDFISIHQYNIGENFRPAGVTSALGVSSLPTGTGSSFVYPSNVSTEDSDGNNTNIGSKNGLGALKLGSNSEVTALQLRALQRLYGALGRDSIIGNRLELWAKTHLNSEVYNEIFRRSNCVGSNRFAISISDVDSLADTRDSGNTQGAVLGNYAGKGIGSGDLSFKCKSDTYGYFIVLSWIEPVTSFWQGTDAQLFAKSRSTFPLKEYDAFGYEITPRSACWNDNNISVNGDYTYSGFRSIGDSQGFGYVPRYSGFKYAKNIVNGDMSLRSLQGSMRPFYLDRTFVSRDFVFQPKGSDGIPIGPIQVKDNKLPVASPVWRWTQRYPWLGNYNTMFYNTDATRETRPIWDKDTWTSYTRTWAQDDNFFIHCVFDFTENSQLRPLSESYDTEVLNSDTSIDVQRQ